MNKVPETVKWIVGLAIVLSGWIFSFAKDQGSSRVEFLELQKDVAEIKADLKTYNIAVLASELKHLAENVKTNNEVLKDFNKFLRELQHSD